MQCCIGDGGGSSVVALQEGATNHPKVRRLRAQKKQGAKKDRGKAKKSSEGRA
jgi:hypothetical protein